MFVNILFHNEYHIYCVHIYLMHILVLKRCEFSTWFNVSSHNFSSASEETSQRGKSILLSLQTPEDCTCNAEQMTVLFLNDCYEWFHNVFEQIIEKRRRDRINNSLSELRRLVPSAFEKQVRVNHCTWLTSHCQMSCYRKYLELLLF